MGAVSKYMSPNWLLMYERMHIHLKHTYLFVEPLHHHPPLLIAGEEQVKGLGMEGKIEDLMGKNGKF
jgi:hypothetical protein